MALQIGFVAMSSGLKELKWLGIGYRGNDF